MNTTTLSSGNHETTLMIALIPSVLIVLFLFYIDEGWYSFRWMLDAGNWIVFVMYLVILYPIQLFIAQFCFRRQAIWSRLLCTTIAGLTLTLGGLWLWMY